MHSRSMVNSRTSGQVSHLVCESMLGIDNRSKTFHVLLPHADQKIQTLVVHPSSVRHCYLSVSLREQLYGNGLDRHLPYVTCSSS
jgi:hypothetical protein